jgi:serine/threonine protein kinase
MIGQILNNRYRITSLLGEGAMGEVYLAIDEHTGQQVAVKVLARQLITRPELIERFRREADTLRQLDHPNIVKFVDTFEHEGQYMIVMEYVPGGSLHDLIKKGQLPIDRAYRIALELCDALIRSHHLNIIHRDIKPENVLLTEDGKPKLADFGVARLSEGTRMTHTGTQVGTPYYMSPEAWEGMTLDAQADIWSLGVVLFEMLAGQVPFGGDTGAAVMNKVLKTQPPDLKKLRAEVSPGLTRIVSRMLTRDKKRRYQTMRQVAVDLESGKPAPDLRFSLKYAGGIAGFLTLLAGLGFAITSIWNLPTTLVSETATPTLAPTLTATETSIPTPEGTPTETQIVASSWQQGKLVYVRRDAANTYHLDMLDFSQSDRPRVLLSPEKPRESRYYSPWLTLDGKGLVFDDFYLGKIFFLDLEAVSSPRLIDNCAAASFAPDGRRVVCYLSSADYFPIYDVQTGEMVSTVNHGMSGAVIPVWSPDGSEIAFSILEAEQTSSIWKVSVDGGNPIPLATDAAEDYTPAWSPDGEWIVFQSTLTSEKSEVWIMRNDGSAREQLTFSGGGSNWSRGPCFSPDGQWLAFVSNRDAREGSDFGEVFVLSRLTDELIQVTDTGGWVLDFRVTWGR